ncbi:site-specific recombinase XerD [Hymenobacter sp. UYAg731]
MSYSLTVLNYLKVAKRDNTTGLAPIFFRVTIGGQRVEISAKRSWDPSRWETEAGKAKGTKEDARTLNTYLDTLRAKLNKQFNQLLSGDEPVTAELLKNTFLNKIAPSKSIMEVLNYHNEQVAARVGTDYAPATLRRYRVGLKKVKLFMKHQYQRADMPLDQLNRRFITEFEHFLKTVEGIQHNTSMNYIKYLKKTVLLALSYEWLDKNPFVGIKHSIREVTREFLTTEELARMVEKPFSIRRLDEVRDIFVFSCYTGYAYADVLKLTPDHILTGINGKKWIMTQRIKTETRSNVPLLPPALAILAKYAQDPECLAKERLLPVKSNQKMNAYLKEVADMCGITKPLTFHIARHTFATTVTLTNGVPIETVSSMLGHKNLRTTQIYAKVVEHKVGEDMDRLEERLNGNSKSADNVRLLGT